MASRFVLAALLAALTSFTACAAERSPRCKSICSREGDCADSDEGKGQNFDQSECVSACAALERDTVGKQLVERHEQCIAKAKTCTEILACE
jgi:hypothetical protein